MTTPRWLRRLRCRLTGHVLRYTDPGYRVSDLICTRCDDIMPWRGGPR